MYTLDRTQYNPALMTDTYKFSHWPQYPPNTTLIHSYLEARAREGDSDEIVFFGLQPYLTLLEGSVLTSRHIERAERFAHTHFHRPCLFNSQGWRRLLHKHKGCLPLEIRAVPEGSVHTRGTPLVSIENTDPEFYWLTNYVETLLMNVWYPCSVATQSRKFYKLLDTYLSDTGSNESIKFRLHDFGMRGVSCPLQAGFGGAAHHIYFDGSDNVFGTLFLEDYYDSDHFARGIPASEHSTITSWGRENEELAYANMLDTYKEGDFACVSDSYNILNAVECIWGDTLKERVLGRKGVTYIRPDSGPPLENLLQLSNLIAKQFGATTNEKGYIVFDEHVRLIQADGVSYGAMCQILYGLSKAGYSAENYFFGSGGALLQKMSRDTYDFALKCSFAEVDGKGRDVWKCSTGKPSKAGRFLNGDLRTVFRDGEIIKKFNFHEVRENSKC